MAKSQHVSFRPSDAEEGGGGWPVSAIVIITGAKATTWEEAGERAITRGRKAEDPALMLEGETEDGEALKPEFLGAGKSNRMVPSDDGEFFEPADTSAPAKGLNKNCNAMVFLTSLFDKKRQGKMAMAEDVLDDGISSIVGIKFRVGRETVERAGLVDDDGNPSKSRPTLVASEIIDLPGKSKGSKSAGKSKKDEDDDEDDAPRKSKSKKGGDGDLIAAAEAAEEAILEALKKPAYRKGIPGDKVFMVVHNAVKGTDHAKAADELAEDSEWVAAKDRPWKWDEDDELITSVDDE